MSLFDLIWIGVILYVIFNGLGRRKRAARTELPDAELPDAELQDRGGAARPGPVGEIRRRLVEAAREWEEEQRRLRGEPPVAAPAPPARVTPPPAEPEPVAVLTSAPVLARRGPGRAASAAVRVRREVERESAGERRRSAVDRHYARRRNVPNRLAALNRYPTLQRAILFGEILGRPKALEDLPDLRP